MKTLHLECATGLGGDMLLAGLADLGSKKEANQALDLGELQAALEQAGLRVSLDCRPASRRGLAGMTLGITQERAEQPLRRLPEITGILDALPLSSAVRDRSRAAFDRLAEVEARVHGVDINEVHFHEIGAVDTVVDVVGAFWALETLGVKKITASVLPWFEGRVDTAHGTLALPAPAVVELLKNKPVCPSGLEVELITPTGALLLDQIVTNFGTSPHGILLGCGMGLGRMELADRANVLRCFLLQDTDLGRNEANRLAVEEIVVLETNIDHLTGEEIGACLEALLDEGALDVLFLPGAMKKGRPGGLLQVLCRHENLARVRQAVFRQTMTLGLRCTLVKRFVAARRTTTRETSLGPLAMKQSFLDGQDYVRPEFEALRQLARRTGRSVAQLRYLLTVPPPPGNLDSGGRKG